MYLLIGPLWGLALVVYFFAYEKNRDAIGLLLFLFVSGSAFVASVKIASLLADGGSLYGMGAPYMSLPSLPFLFTAGSAGALIVLAAGLFVFGSGGLRWKAVANVLLGSTGGGLLAVVAGLAGEELPLEARSKVIDFDYPNSIHSSLPDSAVTRAESQCRVVSMAASPAKISWACCVVSLRFISLRGERSFENYIEA